MRGTVALAKYASMIPSFVGGTSPSGVTETKTVGHNNLYLGHVSKLLLVTGQRPGQLRWEQQRKKLWPRVLGSFEHRQPW